MSQPDFISYLKTLKPAPNYDEFNAKWVEFYKAYTPTELIAEWQMWQEKVVAEVDRIGYSNIRSRPDLFDWLIIDDDDKDKYTLSEGGSHYNHHLHQIKKAISE